MRLSLKTDGEKNNNLDKLPLSQKCFDFEQRKGIQRFLDWLSYQRKIH